MKVKVNWSFVACSTKIFFLCFDYSGSYFGHRLPKVFKCQQLLLTADMNFDFKTI